MKRLLTVMALAVLMVVGTVRPGYAAQFPAGWSQVGDLMALSPKGGNGGFVDNPATVYNLLVFNDKLYAGTEHGVWAWNGFAWSQLIGTKGIYGSSPLALNGGQLYAADVGNVYSWDGSDWSQVGNLSTQTDNPVLINSLVGVRGTLYAATDDGLWSWDGSTWSQVGGSTGLTGIGANVHSLLTVNGTVYAGTSNGVWAWDGSNWSQVGGSTAFYSTAFAGYPATVLSLAMVNDMLFAGTAGGVWAWDGSNWSQVRDSTDSPLNKPSASAPPVWSLITVNGAVYAGTDSGIWSWDGSDWSDVGSISVNAGYPAVVYTLLSVNGTLYAGTGSGGVWSVPPVSRSGGVKFVIGQCSYTVADHSFSTDAAPFVSGGRTLVPVRYLADSLGAYTAWYGSIGTIVVSKGPAIHVEMVIGSTVLVRNGLVTQMDVAPVIVNDRTYLPARYIAEALGYTLGWDATTKTVSISSAQ